MLLKVIIKKIFQQNNHSKFRKFHRSFKISYILGIPANTNDQIVFHSGVAVNKEGQYVTNGGRVLIAVTLRPDLKQAAADSTKICQAITFSGAGAQFRTDIAEKAFKL